MRGILRLVRELQEGDPTAIYVLIFAGIGTVIIVLIVGLIRARRKRQGKT